MKKSLILSIAGIAFIILYYQFLPPLGIEYLNAFLAGVGIAHIINRIEETWKQ